MQRREFVRLVAAAATARPFAARAQQEQPKLVGVLWGASENTANRVRLDAFRQAMHELHWDEGRNLKLDVRWGSGDEQKVRGHASELVALAPDAVLSIGSYAMSALRDTTRTIPIVFIAVGRPRRDRALGRGVCRHAGWRHDRHRKYAVLYVRRFPDRAGRTSSIAHLLVNPQLCRTGRTALLWTGSGRTIQTSRRLCRSYPQRREARRPSGSGADQVRVDHQSQNRAGARTERARRPARGCRRDRRMTARLPPLAASTYPDFFLYSPRHERSRS